MRYTPHPPIPVALTIPIGMVTAEDVKEKNRSGVGEAIVPLLLHFFFHTIAYILFYEAIILGPTIEKNMRFFSL